MADFGSTPNLVAGGTISPFRMVRLSAAADFTGLQADANSKLVVGVTDGSVRRFDATEHAIAGDTISLQPTDTVQVTSSAAITRGALLTSDANGKAVTAGTGNPAFYIALESAGAADLIIRAYRIGAVTA
jgi:hypothetical protein